MTGQIIMSSMHWHKHFAKALTAPDLPPPDGVIRYDGKSDLKRFNVYRNNHVMSLITNLKDGFPVVSALVGDDFFGHMARIYIEQSPPRSPVMVFYGDTFPDFIRQFPPAGELPYLGDIAQIEYTQRLSLHASDAPYIDSDHMPYDAQTLLLAQFHLHPSVHLIGSDYPIFDIWYANQGNLDHDIRNNAQHIILVRHDDTVHLHLVSDGCLRFIKALASGMTLQNAINRQYASTSEALMRWIKFSLTLTTALTIPKQRS
jgi:hypothetical protein